MKISFESTGALFLFYILFFEKIGGEGSINEGKKGHRRRPFGERGGSSIHGLAKKVGGFATWICIPRCSIVVADFSPYL